MAGVRHLGRPRAIAVVSETCDMAFTIREYDLKPLSMPSRPDRYQQAWSRVVHVRQAQPALIEGIETIGREAHAIRHADEVDKRVLPDHMRPRNILHS